tara:strand:- start:29 stop:433 length:405 start_codon:yes stop_codon:yes gene_type:complete
VLQVLIGGALIGLASALLMATNGKIAGISSIVHRAFFLRGEESWTVWFVFGLMLGPAVMLVLGWVSLPNIDIDWGSIIVGGLLVGMGTKVGSGCTSGHGVCGMGRLSVRSFVAVAVFMSVGVMTVLLMRLGGVL